MLYPALTMTKPQAADPLFFPMSSPRPRPPFASIPSPPVSDPILLGAAGVGSAGGSGRAGQLQQAAPNPLPLLSSGAMRCHVASSCLVVWLSVLISGCWGKSNPLPSPPTAGMGGWARRHVVGVCALGLQRPALPCVRLGTHVPLWASVASVGFTGLKIPAISRAWDPGEKGRSLEKYLCSKGGICDDELSFFWDAGTGPGSLQFHGCLLSTYCGSPVCPTVGVWKK